MRDLLRETEGHHFPLKRLQTNSNSPFLVLEPLGLGSMKNVRMGCVGKKQGNGWVHLSVGLLPSKCKSTILYLGRSIWVEGREGRREKASILNSRSSPGMKERMGVVEKLRHAWV